MDITIHPTQLRGSISAVPSKSQAHRLLICAALADAPTFLHCPATSQDIGATVACLQALGADIQKMEDGYQVLPMMEPPRQAVLPCGESGSTLRFLLPVAGALGVDATFLLEGRLPQRPLSPLWEEMTRMGCILHRPTPDSVRCQGRLRPGEFVIDGGVSSQYISGLLFALPLLSGDSRISVIGALASRPYVNMTRQALGMFCVDTTGLAVSGGKRFHSPGHLPVEGDWSNAAFFLAANRLGSAVTVTGLDPNSAQGDQAVEQLLPEMEKPCIVDAVHIPDLVPVLAVVAGALRGAEFTGISRLRLKESDRVQTILDMLRGLGGKAEATEDTLKVYGTDFRGGTVNSAGDHRIAMAAAIAATVCTEDVTILDAQAVNKSYPRFWADYGELGGNYEQHLR